MAQEGGEGGRGSPDGGGGGVAVAEEGILGGLHLLR